MKNLCVFPQEHDYIRWQKLSLIWIYATCKWSVFPAWRLTVLCYDSDLNIRLQGYFQMDLPETAGMRLMWSRPQKTWTFMIMRLAWDWYQWRGSSIYRIHRGMLKGSNNAHTANAARLVTMLIATAIVAATLSIANLINLSNPEYVRPFLLHVIVVAADIQLFNCLLLGTSVIQLPLTSRSGYNEVKEI